MVLNYARKNTCIREKGTGKHRSYQKAHCTAKGTGKEEQVTEQSEETTIEEQITDEIAPLAVEEPIEQPKEEEVVKETSIIEQQPTPIKEKEGFTAEEIIEKELLKANLKPEIPIVPAGWKRICR